jgi:hypothetical protein
MNPLMTRDWLPALSRRHCVPLVAAAATRLPSLNRHAGAVAEDAVFTCRRMYLLERRLRDTSHTLEWSAL